MQPSDTDTPREPVCPALLHAATAVLQKLQQAGYTAYWAGGCVRDMLLERTPCDYDIATNATPEAILKIFKNADAVGKSFGVVIARHAGFAFEMATFRQDHGGSDGRHPDSVTFATAHEDAARRDFTINAMFFNPIDGTLHDYVQGSEDLKARRIRCVGDPDRRFREDHLRLLRAVRFATTLGFDIDPTTAQAMMRQAGKLCRISIERIRDEFTRTLMEARLPGQALRMLDDLQLLPVFLPEVSALKHQGQPPEYHPEGDVFTHTVMMLDSMIHRSPDLIYAILLHDIGKPETAFHDGERLRFHGHAERGEALARRILQRLKLPNRLMDTVCDCVKRHMHFMDVQKMRKATLRRLMGSPGFDLELELHRLDCQTSNGLMENHMFLCQTRQELENEPRLPPPWIRGGDLIALGIQPGPRIGQLLREAYDLQLEGACTDREELLEKIRYQTQYGAVGSKWHGKPAR